jgi:general nucleoside transport system permease protein
MGGGRFDGLATAGAALLFTAIAGSVALLLGGYDPVEAFGALMSGALGSPQRFLSFTLVRSVPLILTGLAVAVAFRTGVWNIGAEGQLYAGAIVGAWIGLNAEGMSPLFAIPLALVAAGAAGAAWAAVPALMKLRLGVGEVITTILMNFVAIYTVSFVVHGPLQEARGVFPQTDPVAEAVRLPSVIPGTRLHLGFLLAVVLAVGLWAFFRYTAEGFRWRAVGASPRAALLSGGASPGRIMFMAFLVSGVFAGLAGGIEVSGRSFALLENLSPGWGYTAIAVALLAGLDPLAVIVTGVFFGALEAGAGAMQRDAGIPAVWVDGIEALVILAVLAADRALRMLRARGASGLDEGRAAELPPREAAGA